MTTDPLAFLSATHSVVQAEAEAARGGSAGVWSADCHPHYDGARIYDGQGEVVVYDEGSPSAEQAAHIARHGPAAVLLRIAADRKQLAEHAAVPDHGRFSERDCDEWAYCDGNHSEPPVCRSCRNYAGDPIEAPCRTVEILAEGWGWTPETAKESST